MSTSFLFILLLLGGIGVLGVACLVALIMLLVRASRPVGS